jgi:coenzyme F420-0:L-glutamate ligase/coenzyme F420-1:gamma-L-glutamate ligase
VEIIGLRLPEVRRGADLAALVLHAARQQGEFLRNGDIVVLTQKIVSKAEGREATLRGVRPSALARTWARRIGRDPRFIELVLRESSRVLRMSDRALVVETRHGFVCANAGVDHSNVAASDRVTLLPDDPDASARRFAETIYKRAGARIAVIVSDTWGRPWREGQVNVAIGAAGLRVLADWRGRRDTFGRPLTATVLAVADELAAAAGLGMGKVDQVPAVMIRGFRFRAGRDSARKLLRPAQHDLFR